MARTIYYLSTQWNTYDQRHDLFNTGARWDSTHRRWWSTRKAAVNRAQRVLGNGDVVRAEVTKLPKVAATHRGGRPRAKRGSRKLVVAQPTNGSRARLEVMKTDGELPLLNRINEDMVATGGPFVRRAEDHGERRAGIQERRQADRRGPNRPAAVLLIPMADDKLAG